MRRLIFVIALALTPFAGGCFCIDIPLVPFIADPRLDGERIGGAKAEPEKTAPQNDR